MDKNSFDPLLIKKAKAIRLLICDVDGVLSDGKVYYSNQGDEIKSFNIKDGLGIKQLLDNGIKVAIITGRQSDIVERRATELGIPFIYQGKKDKRKSYKAIIDELKITPAEVAHVGDDLPDLPLMKMSGLGISVNDGHAFVKQNADWCTQLNGGEGAVREIADLLLVAQDKLDAIQQGFLSA